MAESSEDDEEEIDYNNDEEELAGVKTHRFTIDLVARYVDEEDDLILHWGMSRKKIGAWGTPDLAFQPVESQQWPDGLACQTKFIKEAELPSIRLVTIVIKWVEEVDQPVNSLSFVLTEKNKNVWHSINGSD